MKSKAVKKRKIFKLKSEITDMDRETFYQWGATQEIMEIRWKRNKRPETGVLVDQRNTLPRPGTLQRR